MKQSQHNIEKYLERFTYPGTFLEIGCWDAKIISQTYWLELEKGWTGVCVDPFPKHFNRRTCRLCEKAISADGKPRRFLKVSQDRRYNGDVSYFSGFEDSVKTHIELIKEFCDYEVIDIETITIEKLYQDFYLPRHINFLSVDTEGSELEIFQSMDLDTHSFDLIVFEHNEEDETRVGVGKILASHGYRLLESMRCDDVYAGMNFK